MEEQLISFDTAKLAHKAGFNFDRDFNGKFYWAKSNNPEIPMQKWHYMDWVDLFAAPTQSLLQKWLREKHNIHIGVWFNSLTKQWRIDYIINIKTDNEYNIDHIEERFDSYEEALEIGLQEALKLI